MAIKIQNIAVIDDSRNIVNPGSQSLNNLLPPQTGASGKVLTSNGTNAIWNTISMKLSVYTYDNRANLRSTTPENGDQAIVEGLGLFKFYVASTEPDDDETCFKTSTGCWLLELVSWDFVNSTLLPDTSIVEESVEDITTSLNHTIFLTGTASPGITSVAALATTTFNITVPNAIITDTSLVSPPGTAPVAINSRVSSNSTVTVELHNAEPNTVAPIASGVWKAYVFGQR